MSSQLSLLATATRLLPKRGWSMADTAETKREQNTSIYKLKNVLGPQQGHRCVKYCSPSGFYNPVGSQCLQYYKNIFNLLGADEHGIESASVGFQFKNKQSWNILNHSGHSIHCLNLSKLKADLYLSQKRKDFLLHKTILGQIPLQLRQCRLRKISTDTSG